MQIYLQAGYDAPLKPVQINHHVVAELIERRSNKSPAEVIQWTQTARHGEVFVLGVGYKLVALDLDQCENEGLHVFPWGHKQTAVTGARDDIFYP
jgi:hypothetical protein